MKIEKFIKDFRPQMENGDIKLYETFKPDTETVHKAGNKYVWTLMSEDDELFLVPGIRWVNRINYVICKVPWDNEQVHVDY